jgi:hypothetical protein
MLDAIARMIRKSMDMCLLERPVQLYSKNVISNSKPMMDEYSWERYLYFSMDNSNTISSRRSLQRSFLKIETNAITIQAVEWLPNIYIYYRYLQYTKTL